MGSGRHLGTWAGEVAGKNREKRKRGKGRREKEEEERKEGEKEEEKRKKRKRKRKSRDGLYRGSCVKISLILQTTKR